MPSPTPSPQLLPPRLSHLPKSWRRRAAWGAAAATGVAVVGTAAGAALLATALKARRRRGFGLRGKVVLITGGSRGLGLAIAREFLRQGCRVALCARDPEELGRARAQLEASPGGEVMTVACDLAQPDAAANAVASVAARWGAVEVLVHNAGVMQVGPWETMTEADFHQAMDLHCWAALRLAQQVLPGMIARRQGRIVNISSIGGLVAVPHMLPYSTSKFALVGLSQGLASEVRRHGVRVTCVCPFLTRTGSQENVRLKGRHQQEFAWFTASGLVPGLTQGAAAAARRILRACQSGQPQLTLWWPGKLAALAHGVAPGAVTSALGVAARWLPAPPDSSDALGEPGTAEHRGADSYSPLAARALRPLVHLSGRGLNQPG